MARATLFAWPIYGIARGMCSHPMARRAKRLRACHRKPSATFTRPYTGARPIDALDRIDRAGFEDPCGRLRAGSDLARAARAAAGRPPVEA